MTPWADRRGEGIPVPPPAGLPDPAARLDIPLPWAHPQLPPLHFVDDNSPAAYAAGGDVKGPGSSIGDKIPAFLSDGEFVVNAVSANANRPLLRAINDDPLYMTKYLRQIESTVAAALTRVRATPALGRNHTDRSVTVNVSTYDVHEAFSRAKLWEQRHTLADD
ncbi:hypothetical protein [Nocardia sp. BMG111209]|uniref:hypothetical protein n=1 Tax=Nocardia sp. BMG111209 TaxID=1160137 RepID=UPI0003A9C7E6|nr:hypothetical protein [Nocardia sp. BMG111209]